MSDLLSEPRLSLNELAALAEVSPGTCWRWALKGCRGVKLETFSQGARRYTTTLAYRRFVERCTAISQNREVSTTTSRQRLADIEKAEAELKRK